MRRLNVSQAVLLLVLVGAGFAPSAEAQQAPTGPREVPSRVIPVPDTVSPQLQAVIARPFDPSFNVAPQTTAEWKARIEKVALATAAGLPKLREALGVTVQPATMAGVKVFIVTPKLIARSTRAAS